MVVFTCPHCGIPVTCKGLKEYPAFVGWKCCGGKQ